MFNILFSKKIDECLTEKQSWIAFNLTTGSFELISFMRELKRDEDRQANNKFGDNWLILENIE